MNVHEDILRTIEAYYGQNEFRRCLNSARQNSRGVTFLLQKRKAKWADFDDWYEGWQAKARALPMMSWTVASRNRVVKEEDLETLSQATISFYNNESHVSEQRKAVNPLLTIEEIIRDVKVQLNDKPSAWNGWARLRRRWVDDRLPQYKLVTELCESYRGLSKIVQWAHDESRVEVCGATQFERPCVGSRIDAELLCIELTTQCHPPSSNFRPASILASAGFESILMKKRFTGRRPATETTFPR